MTRTIPRKPDDPWLIAERHLMRALSAESAVIKWKFMAGVACLWSIGVSILLVAGSR